jgi:hypothetical protein
MVPIGVLILGAVVTAAGGYWAWHYQYRVVRLLNGEPQFGRPDGAVGADSADGADGENQPMSGTVATAACGSADLAGRVATDAPGRTSHSVLGWTHFRVVSVVAIEGAAIVACRSTDPGPTPPLPARRRRLRRAPSSSPGQWPRLLANDETLALLIGDGAAAEQAQVLLERWRQAGTVLWLRPTSAAGGIEFCDGRRFALRVALLAA